MEEEWSWTEDWSGNKNSIAASTLESIDEYDALTGHPFAPFVWDSVLVLCFYSLSDWILFFFFLFV